MRFKKSQNYELKNQEKKSSDKKSKDNYELVIIMT